MPKGKPNIKYPSPVGKYIAFESDIHNTGGVVPIDKIKEFKAIISKKKEKEY